MMALAEVREAPGATIHQARAWMRLFRPRQSGGRKTLSHQLARDEKQIERHIREGRFQRSLSLVTSLSGLLTGLEVSYEHYRGSYGQRIMYTPLLLSGALFGAGLWAAISQRAARMVLRPLSLLTIADGTLGFYFHIRGIARKPGGWRIPIFNLIMGPPVFAPLLFATVGFLGLVASFLRREEAPVRAKASRPRERWLAWLPRRVRQEEQVFEQDIREGRFQRMLAAVAAASAFFSWAEALYSHYKNNFRYKIQWSPILLGPPLMIASVGAMWSRAIARTLLPMTSLLALLNGMVGFFYHVRGAARRPGGFSKPWYNILYGPPIFAPLIFSASGFIGFLASLLRREKA